MAETFEEAFYEYLSHNTEFAGRAWEKSPEYQETVHQQEALQGELMALVPEQDREAAETLLEDLDATYNREVDFNYISGMRHCISILKLLDIL